MKKEDVKTKVQAKLELRPDTINIDKSYLLDIIEDAMNDAVAFINHREDNELDDRLITPIKDLCVVRMNLTGVEGISSSSKAGTSESYIEGIPKSIKSKLRKCRRLP